MSPTGAPPTRTRVKRTLLVLLAAGLLAVFVLVRASNRSLVIDDCGKVETFAGREDCLRDALTSESKARGVLSAAVLLDGTLKANPRMRELCHQPSHAIASAHPAPSASAVVNYMNDPRLHVCDWGIVHGLLFQFVSDASEVAEVSGLLVGCEALKDAPSRVGCAASVGHALFEFTGEFSSAAAECVRFEGLLRDCVSGVFMQFFSPVAPSDRGEAIGSALRLEEIADLCALDSRDAAAACYRAAHYAYSQVLGPIRYEMSRSEEPSKIFAEKFLPAYLDGTRFCLSFPEYGGFGCAEELSRMALQLLLSFDDPTLLLAVCDATPSAAQEFCRFASSSLQG